MAENTSSFIGIFSFLVLIMSIVIHEVSHGLAAMSQGDLTAKYQGRLTLNPLKHIDPFGSVILPLLFVLSGSSMVFGWAKPVPYNPYNLKNGRWSELWVAVAGPLSNICIALLFGLVLRFFGNSLPLATIQILSMVSLINLVLAIFNLVPLPPLDGSKILFSLLPEQTLKLRAIFETYGMFLTIFFIFFVWQYFSPAIFWIFRLIVGV